MITNIIFHTQLMKRYKQSGISIQHKMLSENKVGKYHRREIYTEGLAKVVADVWETEFILFLAALAVLPIGQF